MRKILLRKILAFVLLLIVLILLLEFENAQPKIAKLERIGSNLIISVSPEDNEPIIVSNWELHYKGNTYKLGQAVPKLLQGKINENRVIIVSNPTKLIISPDESPLGYSFRENKCTGLLAYFQSFTPPLIPECSDCKSDTTYPQYNLCLMEHEGALDFYSNQWRIYLDMDQEILFEEQIWLYDEEGVLLDQLK